VADNNSVAAPGGIQTITTTFTVTINIINLAPDWSGTPAN